MPDPSSPIPQQLALRFPLRRNATFDNFLVGADARALDQLRHFLEQSDESFLYLWGPSQSGLTHLLHAACHAFEAQGRSAVYMPLAELQEALAAALEGLEQYDLVCLDDLHSVAGNRDAELALFHCYNRVRDRHGKLIVSSHEAVRGLGVVLPDLQSRLQWGLNLHISAPDDDLKARVLQQHAQELGFSLPADVVAFIMKRSERSIGQLLELLAQLDRASLSAQRKLTVPFVKQTLGW